MAPPSGDPSAYDGLELQELQNTFKELVHIKKRQEKLVQYHERRALNLTIAYLILLGGLYFIAVSQGSSASLQCEYWWVLFVIVLSFSVVYFIVFIDAVNKFYWTLYNLDVNRIDQQDMYARICEAKDKTESHSTITIDGEPSDQRRPDPLLLFKRKLCIGIIFSALTVITVMELYACRLFLC